MLLKVTVQIFIFSSFTFLSFHFASTYKDHYTPFLSESISRMCFEIQSIPSYKVQLQAFEIQLIPFYHSSFSSSFQSVETPLFCLCLLTNETLHTVLSSLSFLLEILYCLLSVWHASELHYLIDQKVMLRAEPYRTTIRGARVSCTNNTPWFMEFHHVSVSAILICYISILAWLYC